jgi:hypothetical protein
VYSVWTHAYGSVPKFELERRMGGIGCESLEGRFGHTNDHGALRQGLRGIALASRTLEGDGAIEGDGERHKKGKCIGCRGRKERRGRGQESCCGSGSGRRGARDSVPFWFRCCCLDDDDTRFDVQFIISQSLKFSST